MHNPIAWHLNFLAHSLLLRPFFCILHLSNKTTTLEIIFLSSKALHKCMLSLFRKCATSFFKGKIIRKSSFATCQQGPLGTQQDYAVKHLLAAQQLLLLLNE